MASIRKSVREPLASSITSANHIFVRIIVMFVLFSVNPLLAQTLFQPIYPLPPAPRFRTDFPQLANDGAFDFADIDNDGDVDVLFTGMTFYGNVVAELHLNNGLGDFYRDESADFIPMYNGKVNFADVNSDGHPDVLLTGNSLGPISAVLYLNDGMSNFTASPLSGISGCRGGDVEFADLNGDGAPDLITMGWNGTYTVRETRVYMNNGIGVFSLLANPTLFNLSNGALALEDVDGDGDLDLMITGDGQNSQISRLYFNDGNGNFTLQTASPFMAVRHSDVAFADVDGDGDPDLIISGAKQFGSYPFTALYLNDGAGNFVVDASSGLPQIEYSSLSFQDMDGDGDPDLFISGLNASFPYLTHIYTNDGNGNFSLHEDVFIGMYDAENAFADINGDGTLDLIIVGNPHSTRLYVNDGTASFTEVKNTPIAEQESGDVVTADFNGDGFSDVLTAGFNAKKEENVQLYLNDGNGGLVPTNTSSFVGLSDAVLAADDVDGDGDIDFVISGRSNTNQKITTLYINDGNAVFNATPAPLENVILGSLAFQDLNGDSFPELLLTGYNNASQRVTRLYINSAGSFSLLPNTPFTPLAFSETAFADVDSDGDIDVLIAGQASNGLVTQLYLNDGNVGFSTDNQNTFPGISPNNLIFVDLNGNGQSDLLFIGDTDNYEYIARTYINDGNGQFTEGQEFDRFHNYPYSAAVADFNNDGALDIFLSGPVALHTDSASLYFNDGIGNFTLQDNLGIRSSRASTRTADFDNDGSIDLLIAGASPELVPYTAAYRNAISDPPGCNTTAQCQNIMVEISTDLYVPNPADINNGSASVCGIVEAFLSPAVFDIQQAGNQTIQLTVISSEGDTATCGAFIQVLPLSCNDVNGGTLEAGPERSFCVGTGTPVGINISVTGTTGSLQRWALINATGNIIETRTNNSLFNLDNKTPGNYTIGYMRYESDVNLAGLTNISQINNLQGCFSLASNPIQIFLRPQPFGGVISPTTTTSICANQGPLTRVQVNLTGAVGEFTRFGILDPNDNNRIVGSSAIPNINFNGLSSGNYLIVHLSYQAGVNLSQVQFPSDLTGCYDVSNVIPVDVLDCFGRATLTSQPNPTSAQSYVTFTNPVEAQTTLEVFDLNGRMITQLFNSHSAPGQEYRFEFDASQLPNGVYVYRLTTGREVLIEKFMIAR